MTDMPSIFLGKGERSAELLLKQANRHGLIAGATGTGKTVTLQIMAEGFARAGVPVFMADVKGDLSGISQAGKSHEKLEARAKTIGLDDYGYRQFPVIFWDLFGTKGHPVRITISDMGPLLFARLLDLNETQEGILNIAFVVAESLNMPLIDMKDLRALLAHLAENAKELSTKYGNITAASVGAIQRRLLVMEQQGVEQLFGEPALDFSDLLRHKGDEGYINILAADTLINSPKLYSTFLMWMLTHIYDTFPEVGDPDKPAFVFFFDEAHLLFEDAPKTLVDKIEQIVRLIRSKGVGVYFVTQNPMDIPDDVLGQLGNRVQHALRAYTPRDKKAVKSATDTFRQNPNFKAENAITELGIGEALVSMLDVKSAPCIVDRVLIRPPESRLGPALDSERNTVLQQSPVAGIYEHALDRQSAHEMLQQQRTTMSDKENNEKSAKTGSSRSNTSRRQGYGETLAKSVLRTVGTKLANAIVKTVMKSLRGK